MALTFAAILVEKSFGVRNTGLVPFFFAAVSISAWFGGLGPGLVATMLAGWATAFLFLEPGEMVFGEDDFLRLGVFLAVATMVSYLNNHAKSAKEQAEAAMREATAANHAKDEFLAMLSHELRNPLAPVLTLAEMRENDASLPADVREEASLIRRNIELEIRLIDDLLDVSRMSRGKLAFRFGPVDLHELARGVADMLQCDVLGKSLKLELRLDSPGHHVNGDDARLRQLVWNLLRNAIKFTPCGGSITITTRSGAEGEIVLEVRDTGIGIAPETLPKVFNAFEQGGQATAREFGGLGLGLAIARMVVEAHHGRISAMSDGPGKGATLSVSLPAAASAAALSAPATVTSPEAIGTDGRVPRVLLVEDHADTLRVMAMLLQRHGFTVTSANSAAVARELAAHQVFDVLVSDVSLTDGSGLDLMRELSSTGIRGIAVSGHGSPQDIERSREAGFGEHLIKPVAGCELIRAIRNASPVATTAR